MMLIYLVILSSVCRLCTTTKPYIACVRLRRIYYLIFRVSLVYDNEAVSRLCTTTTYMFISVSRLCTTTMPYVACVRLRCICLTAYAQYITCIAVACVRLRLLLPPTSFVHDITFHIYDYIVMMGICLFI